MSIKTTVTLTRKQAINHIIEKRIMRINKGLTHFNASVLFCSTNPAERSLNQYHLSSAFCSLNHFFDFCCCFIGLLNMRIFICPFNTADRK